MKSFIRTVLRSLTWKGVLLTQALGVVAALIPWLEQWGQAGRSHLPFDLVQQSMEAAFLLLAALAADEAIRRGSALWRTFVAALVVAGLATALTQAAINSLLQVPDPFRGLLRALYTFINVGAVWGTVLMVYLNRQSSARLLARVRGGQLDRAQAERRLIASRLTAVEVQLDPASVSRQLQAVRDLYAAEDPDSEPRMEALINDLRAKVARCAQVP